MTMSRIRRRNPGRACALLAALSLIVGLLISPLTILAQDDPATPVVDVPALEESPADTPSQVTESSALTQEPILPEAAATNTEQVFEAAQRLLAPSNLSCSPTGVLSGTIDFEDTESAATIDIYAIPSGLPIQVVGSVSYPKQVGWFSVPFSVQIPSDLRALPSFGIGVMHLPPAGGWAINPNVTLCSTIPTNTPALPTTTPTDVPTNTPTNTPTATVTNTPYPNPPLTLDGQPNDITVGINDLISIDTTAGASFTVWSSRDCVGAGTPMAGPSTTLISSVAFVYSVRAHLDADPSRTSACHNATWALQPPTSTPTLVPSPPLTLNGEPNDIAVATNTPVQIATTSGARMSMWFTPDCTGTSVLLGGTSANLNSGVPDVRSFRAYLLTDPDNTSVCLKASWIVPPTLTPTPTDTPTNTPVPLILLLDGQPVSKTAIIGTAVNLSVSGGTDTTPIFLFANATCSGESPRSLFPGINVTARVPGVGSFRAIDLVDQRTSQCLSITWIAPPSPTSTATATATATETSTPIKTMAPTATATNTPMATATATSTPTATNTVVPISTSTATVDPCATAIVRAADDSDDPPPVACPTATTTATMTPTATASAAATNTATATATSTPTATATMPPTNTPTETPTTTPTQTPTITPTDPTTATTTPTSAPTATATMPITTPTSHQIRPTIPVTQVPMVSTLPNTGQGSTPAHGSRPWLPIALLTGTMLLVTLGESLRRTRRP